MSDTNAPGSYHNLSGEERHTLPTPLVELQEAWTRIMESLEVKCE